MAAKHPGNQNQKRSQLLLRIGLAIAFLYAGIASLRNPAAWESFLPTILVNHFRADVLLKFFGIYEIVLGLWLLSGRYVRYAAALAGLTLLGVAVSNVHAFDITFRDVALLFSAAALFFAES